MDENSAVRIDRDVFDGLEEEARRQDSSTDHVANAALRHYLEMLDAERAILAKRVEEADKGVFISSEAMLSWMERLEDDINAAPPEPDVFFPPKK